MRISDWSSDVCSSDLRAGRRRRLADRGRSTAAWTPRGHRLFGGVAAPPAGFAAEGVHALLRQFPDDRRATVPLGARDHNLLHPNGADVRAGHRVQANLLGSLPPVAVSLPKPPHPPPLT